MTTLSTITTAEQLEAAGSQLPRCELVKGELRMMSPAGGRHGDYTVRLTIKLGQFIEAHDLGRLYAAETGFVLERNPDSVRAPDIAFIVGARLDGADVAGFIPIAPDLAVETLSPRDTATEVREKVQWWLEHGTGEVWVMDPATRTISVHRPDGGSQLYHTGQMLRATGALQGFTLDLRELFER